MSIPISKSDSNLALHITVQEQETNTTCSQPKSSAGTFVFSQIPYVPTSTARGGGAFIFCSPPSTTALISPRKSVRAQKGQMPSAQPKPDANSLVEFKSTASSWTCTSCFLSHAFEVKQCSGCNTNNLSASTMPDFFGIVSATKATAAAPTESVFPTSTGDSAFKFCSTIPANSVVPTSNSDAFSAMSKPLIITQSNPSTKFVNSLTFKPTATTTAFTSCSSFVTHSANKGEGLFGNLYFSGLLGNFEASSSFPSSTKPAIKSRPQDTDKPGEMADATAKTTAGLLFGSSLVTKPVHPTTQKTITASLLSSDNQFDNLFKNWLSQSSISEKFPFSDFFRNSAASLSFPFSIKPATELLQPKEEGDCMYFKPVLEKLPEKVEVNTGEEEDETLFCERARLYRWCPPSNGTTEGGEWKERGIGDMKLLRHETSQQTRVVMRREHVLKVCCNHRITSSIQLRPMAGSKDRAWTWVAQDFAESLDSPELLTLAVKFKDEKTGRRFQEEFMKAAGAQHMPEKILPHGSNADATPKTSGQKPTSTQLILSSAEQNEQSKVSVSSAASDGSDVILVKEEQRIVTEEQKERARALMLPETYFAFENEPGHKESENEETEKSQLHGSNSDATPKGQLLHGRGTCTKTTNPDGTKQVPVCSKMESTAAATPPVSAGQSTACGFAVPGVSNCATSTSTATPSATSGDDYQTTSRISCDEMFVSTSKPGVEGNAIFRFGVAPPTTSASKTSASTSPVLSTFRFGPATHTSTSLFHSSSSNPFLGCGSSLITKPTQSAASTTTTSASTSLFSFTASSDQMGLRLFDNCNLQSSTTGKLVSSDMFGNPAPSSNLFSTAKPASEPQPLQITNVFKEFQKVASELRTSEQSLVQNGKGEETSKTLHHQTPPSTQFAFSSIVQNKHMFKDMFMGKRIQQLKDANKALYTRVMDSNQQMYTAMMDLNENLLTLVVELQEQLESIQSEVASLSSEVKQLRSQSGAPRQEGENARSDISFLAQSTANKTILGESSQTGDASFSWTSIKRSMFGESNQKPQDTSDVDPDHDEEIAADNYKPQYEPVIATIQMPQLSVATIKSEPISPAVAISPSHETAVSCMNQPRDVTQQVTSSVEYQQTEQKNEEEQFPPAPELGPSHETAVSCKNQPRDAAQSAISYVEHQQTEQENEEELVVPSHGTADESGNQPKDAAQSATSSVEHQQSEEERFPRAPEIGPSHETVGGSGNQLKDATQPLILFIEQQQNEQENKENKCEPIVQSHGIASKSGNQPRDVTQPAISSVEQKQTEQANESKALDVDTRNDSVASKSSHGSGVVIVKDNVAIVSEEQKPPARGLMVPKTHSAVEKKPDYNEKEDRKAADKLCKSESPTVSTAFDVPQKTADGAASFGRYSQTWLGPFSTSVESSRTYNQKMMPCQSNEEEDECLFEKRARLYRFANGQWKERGTGTLKVLVRKDDKSGKLDYRTARLLMRQEQILKLCCNQAISESCPKFSPFANSGTNAAFWTAQDFSDGHAKTENLAVKFMTTADMEQLKIVVGDIQGCLKSGSFE